MAFICNKQSAPHTNDKDTQYGWVAMFCHGDFTGGNLILPQSNFAIKYRPGMLIYLCSNLLHQYIFKFKGTRMGMVNFTHNQDITVLQDDLQV
jgi:thiamine kinase-like enzyme